MITTLFFPHCPVCGSIRMTPMEINKAEPSSFDFRCDNCGLLLGVAYTPMVGEEDE